MKKIWQNIRQWREDTVPGITTWRVIVVTYFGLVFAMAYLVIPGGNSTAHYLALRSMDSNTRIADSLLLVPRHLSLEDRFRLNREHSQLEGRYVKRGLAAGQPITPDNVVLWPELHEEAALVELDAEPDWMFLNEGARVQLWSGDRLQPKRAVVLAIVKSGNKWLALLRKSDLDPATLDAKEKKVRVEL
jgi:hypothetical protein